MTPVGDDEDDDDDDNDDGNNQTGGAENGSLSGTVWFDLNGDGVRDPGEPGIPEINVRLIGQRTMLDYTATGPDGSYRFAAIPSVGYAGVEFVLPDGYSCTIPGLDNHAAPLDTDVIFAEGGVDRQTLNAGLVGNLLPGTPAAEYGWVFGTVWSDSNRDGVRDETYGLTDVEVRLLDVDGNVAASTRTRYHDSHFSMYLFGPLPPGEYAVAFTAPDGYAFTSPGQDSHADPSTGTTGPFAVGGGEAVVRGAGMFLSPTSLSPAAPPVTDTPRVPGGEAGDDGDGAGERESGDDRETVRDDDDDREEVRDDDDDRETVRDDDDDRETVRDDDDDREEPGDDDRNEVDDRERPDEVRESARGDKDRDEDD